MAAIPGQLSDDADPVTFLQGAVLKALLPSTAQSWTPPGYLPPGHPDTPEGLTRSFFRLTGPHGDGVNDGFIHEGILAIVVLTNDDDCSFFDPSLFDPAGPYAETPLNRRCVAHPETLHPFERYVNGLLQLRGSPWNLVFAPIAGVPVDLAGEVNGAPGWVRLTSPDCETPVRDPRLCPRVDPLDATQLVPSCEGPGGIVATPPSRLLGVARALEERGAGVTVHSICQASYADALLAVVDRIERRLESGLCLPDELRVEADGRASCELRALMPPGVECGAFDGYEPVRDESGTAVREHDRALRVIRQLVPDASAPDGVGWFYDTFTRDRELACGSAPRVAFASVRPPRGATLELECSTPLEEIAPGYGTPCDPSAPGACADLRTIEGATLACDPLTRRCGVPCASVDQCWDAGLTGFECGPPDGAAAGFCFDPTCG